MDTVDDLGMHTDVQVMDLDDASDPRKEALNKTSPIADIQAFLLLPPVPGKTQDGNEVQSLHVWFLFFIHPYSYSNHHREGSGCPQKTKILTNQHTTLRRHAESLHLVCFYSLSTFFIRDI